MKKKKQEVKDIPLPLKEEDLKKIPRLEELPPEVFEDFIIKIADNLEKVPLDVLGILVPEIIEVMEPPLKLPPRTALKLVDNVRTIVEWEAKFHSARIELEKDKRIEDKNQ